MTIVERILARVDVSPDGCLLWTGARNHEGYGNINYQGRFRRTHRVMYEAFVGPIPDGLQIDHLCRVRHCANPAHLEPVTNQENALRGLRGRMVTECIHGHPYTDDNTIRRADGRRRCRRCASTYARERSHRVRLEAKAALPPRPCASPECSNSIPFVRKTDTLYCSDICRAKCKRERRRVRQVAA